MEYVKPITSDDDLIQLAKIIGVKIDNILVSHEITKPIPKKGSFIVLLRPEDKDVGHWTAVYDNEYFDSMGEGAPTKYDITKYNEFQLQGAEDDYCGIFCLLWLYMKQHNKMHLLNKFKNLNLTVI